MDTYFKWDSKCISLVCKCGCTTEIKLRDFCGGMTCPNCFAIFQPAPPVRNNLEELKSATVDKLKLRR